MRSDRFCTPSPPPGTSETFPPGRVSKPTLTELRRMRAAINLVDTLQSVRVRTCLDGADSELALGS
jgi:hypothetical protein